MILHLSSSSHYPRPQPESFNVFVQLLTTRWKGKAITFDGEDDDNNLITHEAPTTSKSGLYHNPITLEDDEDNLITYEAPTKSKSGLYHNLITHEAISKPKSGLYGDPIILDDDNDDDDNGHVVKRKATRKRKSRLSLLDNANIIKREATMKRDPGLARNDDAHLTNRETFTKRDTGVKIDV